MIIAIDGTTASGKGTLAKRLAARYRLPHLDTGLLYRATGVAALDASVALDDETACAGLAAHLDLDAFDVLRLRTAEAGQAASKVAALPAVRAALLKLQRDFAAQTGGAVLDGRDIGTVICPDADIKFWIDAKLEVRAARRAAELSQMGNAVTAEEMATQLRERDARDTARDAAPMKPADDAVRIDTTDLGIDQMTARAETHIETVRNADKP